MKIAITLYRIRRTSLLEGRIAKKSQKLNPFFGRKRAIRLQWHCGISKQGDYCVEIHLSGLGVPLYAKAGSGKLYRAMDAALGKIERQLKKRREKRSSSQKVSHSYWKAA